MSNGKPMMVGEYGVQERQSGEKAQWFRDARTTLKTTMSGIAAVVYFDALKSYDWRVVTSKTSYAAYTEMARDPYFNVGPGPLPTPPPWPTETPSPTEAPSPTESTMPTEAPSPTESPSPSDEPSPEPTETTEPSPSPSPSDEPSEQPSPS